MANGSLDTVQWDVLVSETMARIHAIFWKYESSRQSSNIQTQTWIGRVDTKRLFIE